MKISKKLASIALALALVAATFVAIPVDKVQAASGVTISGVLIQGSDVVIASSGTASSDDGLYHLVASDAYQVAPTGTDIAQVPASAAATFTVPLNKNTGDSVLFKKFTVCTVSGGALKAVSNSMYITNPEACASYANPRMDRGKKGILPALDPGTHSKNQPAQLGAQQVNLNIYTSHLGNLAGYDFAVQKFNSLGIQVNVIFLVDNGTPGQYLNPYSADQFGLHNYYGLNATNADGVAALESAAKLLASRYSGSQGHGQVDNFIIGNEVNAWWLWNYMNTGSNDVFVNEYANAFRIMYNGIKSENANANVYTCIDHQWARAEASYYISGKEFLTKFNNKIKSEGNIDWRVAIHPYNAPLTSPMAWETSSNVTHAQNSPYVTMANIEVLTDYLSTPDLLSSTGAVRTVKCSEVGYTSLMGEQYQAASLVFAYIAAMNNSYVDGLVISRELDDVGEIGQGLAYGLCNPDGSQKMGFSYYQNAGDPAIIAQASSIAGVDLTTLVKPR